MGGRNRAASGDCDGEGGRVGGDAGTKSCQSSVQSALPCRVPKSGAGAVLADYLSSTIRLIMRLGALQRV